MPDALRFSPSQPYWHDGKVIYTGPAMLASVTDPDGALVGCHITWIDPDAPGKKAKILDPASGDLLPSKKLRGSKRNGAIKLIDPPNATRLVIGEGIETVASVSTAEAGTAIASSSAYWSAIDLGHLGAKVAVPECFTEIVILGDGDSARAATETALRGAAKRWGRTDRVVGIAWAPDGQDFNDVLMQDGVHAICNIIGEAVQTRQSEKATGSDTSSFSEDQEAGSSGKRRPTQRDKLLDLVADWRLWHDANGVGYASILVDDHWEHWPIRSRQCRQLLALRFYEASGASLGASALEDALRILEAQAVYRSPEFRTFRRVGKLGDTLFLDLADASWRAVAITRERWRVVTDVPIKFIRTPSMRALPEPQAGGMIEALRNYTNVASDEDFTMVVGFVVSAVRVDCPHYILILIGEPGASKSTLARALRTLIDPNEAPICALPYDERDLAIVANAGHLMCFDNLSDIRDFQADSLCRLASGAGFSTRKLHSDDELVVFSASKPCVLNGIGSLGDRSDLVQRALVVHLPAITDKGRKEEAEYWASFEAARPELLGSVLDAVVAALRHFAETKLERLPRQADAVRWVEAASSGLGWDAGTFLRACEANRERVYEDAIEGDPIATGIRSMMASPPLDDEPERVNGSWEGSATALLNALNARASEATMKSRAWPKNPSAMGAALRRCAPLLRRAGFAVDAGKSNSRFIYIAKRETSR